MHVFVASFMLTTAVLFPKVGNAQVFQVRAPGPVVTAASAAWQVNDEPIVVNGLPYYPTREYRLFSGDVMTQVGVYDRVPVYADVTLEPYSIAYVPVGGARMRTYERKREGAIAGTTGSRTPSFPVDVPSTVPKEDRAVGTGGSLVPAATDRAVLPPAPSRPRRVVIESVPRARPAATNGVWIEFNGARWYHAGTAASYSADRFAPVGEYHGFPVYRDSSSSRDEIWVQVVKDGPLAPYKKR
jgi:hypothetical protein